MPIWPLATKGAAGDLRSDGGDRLLRVHAGLALFGALLCLVLLAVRTGFAISFSEPLQVQTSGDEFTQLYAIWRYVEEQPVYTDRLKSPFYVAMYNWLFYEFFGFITGLVLRLLSLGSEWIPTVGRVVSLLAIAVGIPIVYATFLTVSNARSKTLHVVCLSLTVFIMAGPLVGFWNITVRPDVWSRSLEAIAVALFLLYYPRRPWTAVLAVIVAAYLAWAFRQGNVLSPAAVGLLLVFRRDWSRLIMLCILLPLAWGVTLALGEPQFVHNVLFVDYPLSFDIERMVRNVTNFGVKSGPVLFFLAALAVAASSRALRQRLGSSDGFVVAAGGAFVAAAISIPGSAQSGGSENYFFSLSYFLALMVAASLPALVDIGTPATRSVLTAGAAGWATLSAAIVLVLVGTTGVRSVRAQHETHMDFKRCLDTVQRPLYVANHYLALPWMTPGNVPYVLSYVYGVDRSQGRSFEHGGIGGLVADRYFSTIVLAETGSNPPDVLDGASLDAYEREPSADCSGYVVLVRRPDR